MLMGIDQITMEIVMDGMVEEIMETILSHQAITTLFCGKARAGADHQTTETRKRYFSETCKTKGVKVASTIKRRTSI